MFFINTMKSVWLDRIELDRIIFLFATLKTNVSWSRFFADPRSQSPFEPRDKISYPWLQSADESSSSAVRSSARERLLCSGLWAARPGLAAAGDTHAGTEALGAPVDPKGGKPVRAKPVERVADPKWGRLDG